MSLLCHSHLRAVVSPLRECGLVLACALACLAGTVTAGVSIDLGTIQIPKGTSTWTVDVMATGGAAFTDMNACFQIGDGGLLFGGSAAPKITSIDLSESVWSSAPGGFLRVEGVTYPTQYQELSVSLSSPGQTVAASGRLCRLVLNTAGYSGTFALKMTSTALGGGTSFQNQGAPVAASLTNGQLVISDTQPPPVPPVPPALSIRRLAGGNVELRFPAESGRSYGIEWSADASAGWRPVGALLGGATGTTLQWIDDGALTGTPPNGVGRRFYRVSVR